MHNANLLKVRTLVAPDVQPQVISRFLHRTSTTDRHQIGFSRIFSLVPLLLGIIYCILLKAQGGRKRNPKNLPLPPGPKGLPIIGNVHQMFDPMIFDKWTKEYGPIVHAKIFGKDVVLLNTGSVGKDLLETRHQNYSGRPRFVLASEAMQDDMMFPFIHANERFRRVRKLVTTEMRPQNVTKYFNPVQTVEVHRMVKEMIDTPTGWRSQISRAIASIITTVVYDKPLKAWDRAEQVLKNVSKLSDGLAIATECDSKYVDFLPWVRYIPFMPYKRKAAEYFQLAETTYKALMDEAKNNVAAGKPANGIAARLHESQTEIEADYREQYWALGVFYLAGCDTQSIMSHTMMLALASHPEVMARAQAELDTVVGPDRLPTYADEENLPYVTAMIKEMFRWRPLGPHAIPHAAAEDDEYNGYFIPKGSMVLPNIWSMHMDPVVFKNPEIFDPQRYLDQPNLPNYVFGFGRRVCPGQRMAEQTLFLEFATICWALNVTPATDPTTGQPIPIDTKRETGFTFGGVMRAHNFRLALTPRSPEKAQLLAAVVEQESL